MGYEVVIVSKRSVDMIGNKIAFKIRAFQAL
jgi:hypothetical protein